MSMSQIQINKHTLIENRQFVLQKAQTNHVPPIISRCNKLLLILADATDYNHSEWEVAQNWSQLRYCYKTSMTNTVHPSFLIPYVPRIHYHCWQVLHIHNNEQVWSTENSKTSKLHYNLQCTCTWCASKASKSLPKIWMVWVLQSGTRQTLRNCCSWSFKPGNWDVRDEMCSLWYPMKRARADHFSPIDSRNLHTSGGLLSPTIQNFGGTTQIHIYTYTYMYIP